MQSLSAFRTLIAITPSTLKTQRDGATIACISRGCFKSPERDVEDRPMKAICNRGIDEAARDHRSAAQGAGAFHLLHGLLPHSYSEALHGLPSAIEALIFFLLHP